MESIQKQEGKVQTTNKRGGKADRAITRMELSSKTYSA